jgi:hypothetical protein
LAGRKPGLLGRKPGLLGPKPRLLGPKPRLLGPKPGLLGPKPGLLGPKPGLLGPKKTHFPFNTWLRNSKRKLDRMRKAKKLPTKTASVLPVGTSTSTPATVHDPPTSVPVNATATSAALALTEPPDWTIPAPPAGFVPVNLLDYRGSHPKVGQIAALPGAIAELEASSTYATVFGAAAPSANQLAGELAVAGRWTTLRVAAEALLGFLKSYEAITWKTALTDLDKLDALFQVFQAQNPAVVAAFPETAKLLDVPKVIGQRAAAARVRNKAKKALSPAPAAPVAAPAATGTENGGGSSK